MVAAREGSGARVAGWARERSSRGTTLRSATCRQQRPPTDSERRIPQPCSVCRRRARIGSGQARKPAAPADLAKRAEAREWGWARRWLTRPARGGAGGRKGDGCVSAGPGWACMGRGGSGTRLQRNCGASGRALLCAPPWTAVPAHRVFKWHELGRSVPLPTLETAHLRCVVPARSCRGRQQKFAERRVDVKEVLPCAQRGGWASQQVQMGRAAGVPLAHPALPGATEKVQAPVALTRPFACATVSASGRRAPVMYPLMNLPKWYSSKTTSRG